MHLQQNAAAMVFDVTAEDFDAAVVARAADPIHPILISTQGTIPTEIGSKNTGILAPTLG